MEDLAVYGLRFLALHYPERMEERYGIGSVAEDLVETFDAIGKRRRVFGQGGEIDYDQVALLVVRDIRDQHLGKLTFDSVAEQIEKEELEKRIAEEDEQRRLMNLELKKQRLLEEQQNNKQ